MLGTWHSFCLQSIRTATIVTAIIYFIISHVQFWRLIFQSLIVTMPSNCHQAERFSTSREIFCILEYITLICVCVWSLEICAACVHNCLSSSSGVFHMFCIWSIMSAASVSKLLEWGTSMNMLTLCTVVPNLTQFDLLQSLCNMH